MLQQCFQLSDGERHALEAMATNPLHRDRSGAAHTLRGERFVPATISALEDRGFCRLNPEAGVAGLIIITQAGRSFLGKLAGAHG